MYGDPALTDSKPAASLASGLRQTGKVVSTPRPAKDESRRPASLGVWVRSVAAACVAVLIGIVVMQSQGADCPNPFNDANGTALSWNREVSLPGRVPRSGRARSWRRTDGRLISWGP